VKPWHLAASVVIGVSAFGLWVARADRGTAIPPAPQQRLSAVGLPTGTAPPQQRVTSASDARVSVAAMEFQSLQNLAEFDGLKLGIADAFAASLARSGRFRVVERTQLDRALQELDLNQTDRIDAATAQRIGRLIGAQYMIVGSFQVIGGQIKISARLMRVETAEIVRADSATGPVSGALALPDTVADRFVAQMK
jgi:TolB-like protein